MTTLVSRLNQVIFKADNVLTADVVRAMFRLRQQVARIDHRGQTWQDTCLRIPVVRKPRCFDPAKFSLYDYFFGRRRRRRSTEDDFFADDEEDDFFDDDNSTSIVTSVSDSEDPECANMKVPDLSAFSLSELAEIKSRMETEGFSLALGE